MAIHVQCPSCGTQYALPDRTQSRAVVCKACGAEVPVRGPGPAGGPTRPDATPAGADRADDHGHPRQADGPLGAGGGRAGESGGRAGRRGRYAGLLGAAVLAGGFCLIAVGALALASPAGRRVASGLAVALAATASAGGLVVAVYYVLGQRDGCPDCGRLFARVYLGDRVIRQERAYGLVKRTARTRGWMPGPGGQAAPAYTWQTWEERVPVVRVTISHDSRCRFCGHEWGVRETKEHEDFDRA